MASVIQAEAARSRVRRESVPAAAYPKWEGYTLALIVLGASLFVAHELVFRYNYINVDAWTRSLEALYAVLRPGFHLAAMGFIWNPLPSLLTLPFAELRGVWPSLMQEGFASNIISAMFAAVGVYHLNRVFWRFGISRPFRIVLSILYYLAPLILLYSGNGMTDEMECATFIACLDGIIEYFQDDRLLGLVRAAVWLALAFMIRYESIAFGGMLGIGMVLTTWRHERYKEKGIAIAMSLLFPIISAVIIWMILNWMIMGNPLFFLLSKAGNASQISAGGYNNPFMLAARHNLPVAMSEVAQFTILFWPILPVAAVVAVLQLRKKADPMGLPLLLATFGPAILQIALLYLHKSAEWDRFFIYYIPFGAVLCAYLYYRTKSHWNRKSVTVVMSVLLSLLFLSSDVVGVFAMQNPIWGHGDSGEALQIFYGTGHQTGESSKSYEIYGRKIAGYINAHPGLKVLVSTFNTFGAVPYIKNQNQIVISNDADYKSVMLNPRGRVNAIIIAQSNVHNLASDNLDSTYPTMWAGKVPWTKLIHQFPNGNRLYAVLSNAP